MSAKALVALPALLLQALAGASAFASSPDPAPVVLNGVEYASWAEWIRSDAFRRCGTPEPSTGEPLGVPNDCGLNNTAILPEYEPGAPITITVVFHVITTTPGTTGNVTDENILEQVEILNEDFQALLGTNGQNGTNAMIRFELATTDPSGNPTDGITRSANSTWYNDSGSYWNTLAWDPSRYLNIYTNSAGGNLGYVPFLPQQGGVGTLADRVVILWSTVGRDAPIGPPYDQGRSATHEVGHYLGLFHTFQGGCASGTPPGCYTSGDRICDTNSESAPVFACPPSSITCGTIDPFHNYMDYSDDLCMEEFTSEQVNRMRCTLEHWRPDLHLSAVGVRPLATAGTRLRIQARPNPFTDGTEILFELPRETPGSLRIIDVAGRAVRTLASGPWAAGPHRVAWDGTDAGGTRVASGVYFYRLETQDGAAMRRLVLRR